MQDTKMIYENLPDGTETTAVAGSDREQLMRLISLLSHATEDPIEGLAGYLVTEDPTYLPDHAEIKMLVRLLGRDKLLRLFLGCVLKESTPTEEV